jgi:hypothetical protein
MPEMHGSSPAPPRRSAALTVATLAAIALAFALVMGPTSPAKAGDRQVALYRLKAEGGRLHAISGRHHALALVLRNPRTGGRQSLRGFVRDWKRNGFQRNPPTAAVVVADAPKDHDVQIVELRHPRLLEGGDVRFQARADGAGADGVLQRFQDRADLRLDHRFGEVSVVIDPTQLVTLTLTFQNLPPVVAQTSFAATFTNASFATPGDQGFTVIADGGVHVELRAGQLLIESEGFNPASGLVGFRVTTQDQFVAGSVTRLPAGMSGSLRAGPDVVVPLKPGGFRFKY